MDFSEKIPAKLAEAGKELPFAIPPGISMISLPG